MDAGALAVAIGALSVAVAVLSVALVCLLAERRAREGAVQTARDLLDENLVHAVAEMTLRIDELARKVDTSRKRGSGQDDGLP